MQWGKLYCDPLGELPVIVYTGYKHSHFNAINLRILTEIMTVSERGFQQYQRIGN